MESPERRETRLLREVGTYPYTSRRITHLKHGGLKGWKHTQSAGTRHRHIDASLRADGYKITIDRLLALERLDESRDPAVARVAREDIHWLQRNHGKRRYD